ncbi:hypothetical protein CONPUDRAFT_83307 [Coniophora puteana RWD-64-598 SS2]|uniref:Uncharacterized protein n=1 Tax=Coniophora puteana (strain RWD-64-598) TaxID=741705 RepID=A0A5M3MIU9_CONPW|nr:uncharacterized protein CONPUDRAFT_83307 [Coniophora puteana RWD-64-598 SS2]EIW78907.1 hypothetical protein CONPUDRAFT_83307 [Coniophora puteana RWD-64-598 SS2]
MRTQVTSPHDDTRDSFAYASQSQSRYSLWLPQVQCPEARWSTRATRGHRQSAWWGWIGGLRIDVYRYLTPTYSVILEVHAVAYTRPVLPQ